MKQKSWLGSALSYTCPRCRKEKLFKEPFEFQKPLDMPDNCPNCDVSFQQEPGFYYGAMFLSYILSAFILLPIALLMLFVAKSSVFSIMAWVIVIGGLLFFPVMRFSRSLWIHMMVKYDKRHEE